MKKLLLFVLLLPTLFFVFSKNAEASLVEINKNGGIVWTVLGENNLDIPKSSSLEIKKLAEGTPSQNATVELQKDNGKVNMVVATDSSKSEITLNNFSDSLVQIEERGQTQQIDIKYLNNKFVIEQSGVEASTDFPLSIDSKTANITATTPSGEKYVSILPYQAVQTALRSKIVSDADLNSLSLTEDGQELSYIVPGNKLINIFNVFAYPVSVKMHISASTGEILNTDAPSWYKVFGFLFL